MNDDQPLVTIDKVVTLHIKLENAEKILAVFEDRLFDRSIIAEFYQLLRAEVYATRGDADAFPIVTLSDRPEPPRGPSRQARRAAQAKRRKKVH